ncbi:RNA-binding motif, single-stranded-interacting protein 3 isoform 5 [Cricetulus griseus]|uniref:RNA-binding motif, single-stranded-interacting protein 3 isoform 5 n=1 Tax=Cricetulus griseus TaxID=10029 RepID=A0A061I5W9_CRIGR|nr:RNA-binding motif, single-stranded-interacting protein 3 isoform 5 [Cricetulus griseus]
MYTVPLNIKQLPQPVRRPSSVTMSSVPDGRCGFRQEGHFAPKPSFTILGPESRLRPKAVDKQQEQDPTNLYISNLPISMDEQELENMLKPFGHVISTRILRDANGVSRGVGFARMESTEKCEVVIQHFNGKYLKTPPGIPAPSEPLLCKFADGGQKKRQNQSKYTQNGRPWPREGEAGMALTYDPTAALQNGFYSSPYSLATNRMIPQTSITPFIAASPVSTYQGAVITPTMDHPMSMQPTNIVGPLTQQMNHLSLGTAGTIQSQDRIMVLHQLLCQYMTAAPMQGTYIPQYTPVPPTAVSIEGVVADTSPQTVAPSSQDSSGQQQQLAVDTPNEHAPAYSFQQSNCLQLHGPFEIPF